MINEKQICLVLTWILIASHGTALPAWQESGEADPVVEQAVTQLIEIQEPDGGWPYEGVYRVRGEIPVGYRIGGTAIVCSALLQAGNDPFGQQAERKKAISKGVELILQELEHPLMKPDTRDAYDVRVWGHIYALNLFAQLNLAANSEAADLVNVDQLQKTNSWIPKLVSTLQEQEIKGGGWNYANQRSHAAFVTAPAVQALLVARQTGEAVPDELLKRSASILKESRNRDGAYQYSGTTADRRPALLPGSIARSAICESTLLMLGQGDPQRLQSAVDAFHEHWDELEKRRQKTGTHEPPYGVAPYYFYYGHRYLAQAISFLPEENRDAEYKKFKQVLLRTRDDDGTWNDRVFDRSRAFGTAMALLALSAEQAR